MVELLLGKQFIEEIQHLQVLLVQDVDFTVELSQFLLRTVQTELVKEQSLLPGNQVGFASVLLLLLLMAASKRSSKLLRSS